MAKYIFSLVLSSGDIFSPESVPRKNILVKINFPSDLQCVSVYYVNRGECLTGKHGSSGFRVKHARFSNCDSCCKCKSPDKLKRVVGNISGYSSHSSS